VPAASDGLERIGEPAIYAVDGVVRRAQALQEAVDGGPPLARVAPVDADRLGLKAGNEIRVSQSGRDAMLTVCIDERVPSGAVWLQGGLPETGTLGESFGAIELNRL
jgi:NADH-quinone oxidoreductase subunit G